MVGSGTSVEVAREMGIEAYGLDLHSGFNILKTSILATVGKPSDLVLSHPPYHDMIPYSGSEWGRGGGRIPTTSPAVRRKTSSWTSCTSHS